MPRSTRSWRPATMPIGTPISSASATATSIRAIVIIVSSQKPSTPQPANASTPTTAARVPPVRQPMIPTSGEHARPAQRPQHPQHGVVGRREDVGDRLEDPREEPVAGVVADGPGVDVVDPRADVGVEPRRHVVADRRADDADRGDDRGRHDEPSPPGRGWRRAATGRRR